MSGSAIGTTISRCSLTEHCDPTTSFRASQPQFSARYHKIETQTLQGGVLTFQGDTGVRQVGADCVR